jgi:hypothetical protein
MNWYQQPGNPIGTNLPMNLACLARKALLPRCLRKQRFTEGTETVLLLRLVQSRVSEATSSPSSAKPAR